MNKITLFLLLLLLLSPSQSRIAPTMHKLERFRQIKLDNYKQFKYNPKNLIKNTNTQNNSKDQIHNSIRNKENIFPGKNEQSTDSLENKQITHTVPNEQIQPIIPRNQTNKNNGHIDIENENYLNHENQSKISKSISEPNIRITESGSKSLDDLLNTPMNDIEYDFPSIDRQVENKQGAKKFNEKFQQFGLLILGDAVHRIFAKKLSLLITDQQMYFPILGRVIFLGVTFVMVTINTENQTSDMKFIFPFVSGVMDCVVRFLGQQADSGYDLDGSLQIVLDTFTIPMSLLVDQIQAGIDITSTDMTVCIFLSISILVQVAEPLEASGRRIEPFNQYSKVAANIFATFLEAIYATIIHHSIVEYDFEIPKFLAIMNLTSLATFVTFLYFTAMYSTSIYGNSEIAKNQDKSRGDYVSTLRSMLLSIFDMNSSDFEQTVSLYSWLSLLGESLLFYFDIITQKQPLFEGEVFQSVQQFLMPSLFANQWIMGDKVETITYQSLASFFFLFIGQGIQFKKLQNDEHSIEEDSSRQ